jgi:hypothetical protein
MLFWSGCICMLRVSQYSGCGMSFWIDLFVCWEWMWKLELFVLLLVQPITRGVTFSKALSKLKSFEKARTSLFTEMWPKRYSNFELWALHGNIFECCNAGRRTKFAPVKILRFSEPSRNSSFRIPFYCVFSTGLWSGFMNHSHSVFLRVDLNSLKKKATSS